MNKVKLILIGAGQRGAGAYLPYVLDHPEEAEVIGVADPRINRRQAVADTYKVPLENVCEKWEDILYRDKFADAVIIATQDKMHYEPAIAALEQGYHVLCEKPMSPDALECIEMGNAAQKYDKALSICHVLRYTPFFEQVKSVIDSGVLGDVMAIQLIEQVAYWHQAHSFVRGNWRRKDESSPMIMAKSCHDLDILLWLVNDKCTNVSSYGHLTHFTHKNAPKGAPERCLDGCPSRHTCPYYAPRIYLDWKGVWQADVLRKVVSLDTSNEGLLQALKSGPYGRCVYYCDNDVVDHQVVNLDFENGAVASFTMSAFTNEQGRHIKVMGTKGDLIGVADDGILEYKTFLEKNKTIVKVNQDGGHMGGDPAIMRDFISIVASDGNLSGRTSAAQSVESHIVALAAEESRIREQNVNVDAFIKSVTRK